METNVEKFKLQIRKGLLEYCILLIIKQSEVYATDLIKKLEQNRLIVVEGTIYPLLSRLNREGIVTYRWEESIHGAPRKYYSLTKNGVEYLESITQEWEEIVVSINLIKLSDKKRK